MSMATTKIPRLTLRRGEEDVVLPLVLRETLLGRIDSNHVVLEDSSVSRIHARVVLNGDSVEIEDCGSTSGTLVNGDPIDRIRLRDGDLIRLGNVKLVYSE